MRATERLYYADSYLTQFTARVVAQRETPHGPEVALDRSAFYPESGGQPADHGTLNQVAVLDVQVEDGIVWHRLAAPLADDVVQGVIDWQRRFDHMQQHHGQHLLSAAFEQLFRFRTVSFHLGVALVTIDLNTPTLTSEQAAAAADLANQVIWEDRPIHARFVTTEELATLTLRKPPTVSGPIRVVSVPDFDDSACGGTHPRSTGGVGLVHVRRWERRGETVRVEFLCGERAARAYRDRDALLLRIANQLSVGPEELEAALQRLRSAEEQSRKQLAVAQATLIDYEAQTLLAQGQLVRQAFDDRNVEEVRMLAKAIAAQGGVALFGIRGDKTQLIFARAEGLALDCGTLLRAVVTPRGGRGGGQAALAQGGLPDATLLDEALDAAFAQATDQA